MSAQPVEADSLISFPDMAAVRTAAVAEVLKMIAGDHAIDQPLILPASGLEKHACIEQPMEHTFCRLLLASAQGIFGGDTIRNLQAGTWIGRDQVLLALLQLAAGCRLPTNDEVRRARRWQPRRTGKGV